MYPCEFRIAFAMETGIAVARRQGHRAFEIETDIVFIGKADPAMHLDG